MGRPDDVSVLPSIFEHIRSHIRVDGPGLTKGGDELPDEAYFCARHQIEVGWVPGGLEGAGCACYLERPLLIITLAFAAGIATGVYISFPAGPLLIAAALVLRTRHGC